MHENIDNCGPYFQFCNPAGAQLWPFVRATKHWIHCNAAVEQLLLLSLACHRAFDVELLYIAQCFKIPIAEVAVNWTEIEGWFLWNMWTCAPPTVSVRL